MQSKVRTYFENLVLERDDNVLWDKSLKLEPRVTKDIVNQLPEIPIKCEKSPLLCSSASFPTIDRSRSRGSIISIESSLSVQLSNSSTISLDKDSGFKEELTSSDGKTCPKLSFTSAIFRGLTFGPQVF